VRYVFLIYGTDESDDHAATTVRSTPRGVVVSDGQFAEHTEAVGRVCVAELRDLDEALRVAKRLVRDSVAVEIRPARSAS
jgi:hypothetical protein